MILLVGGTGFIGKHLCVKLHERRLDATVVSRAPDSVFLAEHAPSIKYMALSEFRGESGRSAIRNATTVVYLATSSVPASNLEAPEKELAESVGPAFALFDRVSNENTAANIVFLSSGGMVYGRGHHSPIPETAPLEPATAYGLGKAIAEQCLGFIGRTRGVEHCVLRVSNPVGSWQNNPRQGFVAAAMRAIRNSRPITLFGDGGQVRDFLDCDELADVIIMAALDPKLFTGVWNVGSGRGVKILEALRIVEDIAGRSAEIIHQPERPSDIPYSVLDCTKIGDQAGWRSQSSLEDVVKKTWKALS